MLPTELVSLPTERDRWSDGASGEGKEGVNPSGTGLTRACRYLTRLVPCRGTANLMATPSFHRPLLLLSHYILTAISIPDPSHLLLQARGSPNAPLWLRAAPRLSRHAQGCTQAQGFPPPSRKWVHAVGVRAITRQSQDDGSMNRGFRSPCQQ